MGSSGVWKIVLRVSSAASFLVLMPAKGIAEAGFRIAVSKSVIAAVTASTEEVFGMGMCVGNHLMVLAMRSACVSMINARYHR